MLAGSLGGFVGNTAIEAGLDQLHTADVDVQVPSGRFEDLVTGLRRVGTLSTLEVKAQEVGEEYVDVGARLRNAQRLERRLLDLLASRTGRLKDVLEIEQALGQVREDVERLQGRMRYLQSHAAMSEVTVTLREAGLALAGAPTHSILADAVIQAWRNFLYLLVFVVQALGVIVPLAVVALAGWAVHRRFAPAGVSWIRLRRSAPE